MPATKWETLAAHIRQQIESGELQPGDQLPSTSKLKTEHRVSDSVIRFAMHSLRSEGWVESVHGVGVFVAERPNPTNATPTGRGVGVDVRWG